MTQPGQLFLEMGQDTREFFFEKNMKSNKVFLEIGENEDLEFTQKQTHKNQVFITMQSDQSALHNITAVNMAGNAIDVKPTQIFIEMQPEHGPMFSDRRKK